MTFADKYSKHAYADLIREAETQGIGLGVQAERERIIALLETEKADYHRLGYPAKYGAIAHAIALIRVDETPIIHDNDATYIKGDDK